jgi:hypothetical protein
MATEIGTIKTVIGTVFAQATDGSQRALQTSDIVFENETILTGELGAVEIALADGSLIDLGRNSKTILDPTIIDPTKTEQNVATNDVELLQQAIIDGNDPTQTAEPTAAGTNDDNRNEGTTIIQVQHASPAATPSSGFDTTGLSFASTQEIEQLDDQLQVFRPDNNLNGLPLAGENTRIAIDDDTLGGNRGGIDDDSPDSQNLSGMLSHDFGSDGQGTVLLLDSGAPAGFIYTLNDDGTVMTVSQDGTDILIFSLSDTTSGQYTVNQLAPISHAVGQNENNQNFNINYQVTDGDGDTVSGKISISADDDTPVIVVAPDSVNDTVYSFTVTNHPEVSSAGYNTSYGYYVKDADGNPTTGVVIWDNVKDADATSITISGQFSPDQIGFFIIADGDDTNPSLTDNTDVTFQFINGEWHAFDAGQPLIGQGSPVFLDNANLNKDNEDHVQDNALTGNQNWEDLPIVSGDSDYNDVNVNVEWTAVTTTGDSVSTTSFGADSADGPDSIDFTLDEIIISGDLTSNGKEVIFEAKDTDNDGHNDLILGSTEDGHVLSIDGILDSEEVEIELFAPIESTNNGSDDVEITANVNITDSDGDSVLATLNFNLDINQITETATPLTD